jgi:hypothetical protein
MLGKLVVARMFLMQVLFRGSYSVCSGGGAPNLWGGGNSDGCLDSRAAVSRCLRRAARIERALRQKI